MTFFGYKRPDGRVGVRNKVLILPASVCASDTTRIIAQQVVGSVTFSNQLGCSQVASDQQLTMDVMAGYAANPNIYGTVVVSLGCENCQMDLVVKAIQERTNKPIKQVIIQEVGGTLKAVDIAVRYAKEMVAEASLLREITGEQPVALLDDVMSELDVSRQDYILNHIEGWQVFITCCEPAAVLRLTGGSLFRLEQGRIIPEAG